MRLNKQTFITLSLLAGLVAMAVMPWEQHINVPAVMAADKELHVYAPDNGSVLEVRVSNGQDVEQGDLLAVLHSQELQQLSLQANIELDSIRKELSRLAGNSQTKAQRQVLEKQVEQLHGGYLAHVFSSCDATLAKAPFVVELADKWVESDDPIRKRCGYGLLYEISKSKKKSAPDDAYFLNHIAKIDSTYETETTDGLMSMAGALMGIGKRSKVLNESALAVAIKIGPIDFDPDGRCDPMDVTKHLTSDYLKEKLGL